MSDFRSWAPVPPRGWNSWDCFGAGVTEEQIRANADYMAKHLKPYGWEYVVCDIQWYEPKAVANDYNNFTELTMDGYGRLMPAVNRFPSAAGGAGFKNLADYVHSLGLKFGIHMMRGAPRQAVHADCPVFGGGYTCREIAHPFSVCSWNTDMYGLKDCEGSQRYYDSVISLYASWGVDFIKCDDICITEFRKWDEPYSAYYEIEMLRRAIDSCGREIVLSLSPGPALIEKAEHLTANANMWRITGDFWDGWDSLHAMFDRCRTWEGVVSPGAYPDCDMLPIGRLSKNGVCHGERNRYTAFTHAEQYTMMTLWGICKSPLMIGGNMPENDEFTLSLLTNSDYMEMHSLCESPRELSRDGDNIVWAADGPDRKYLALFNTGEEERELTVDLTELLPASVSCRALDIWSGADLGAVGGSLTLPVEPHGARAIKISGV